MAVVNPFQTNFTAGELSPKLAGHVDFDKYKNSQIQKEITFYKPKNNVDNAFARWFLNDPKFTELENLQYPNGFN